MAGKTSSDTVKLLKCGRCREVWFCGEKCQRKEWKVHKQSCKVGNHAFAYIVLDEEKSDFEALVKKKGFMMFENNDSAIVRDAQTGRYFDSLTDEGVFFFPSEKAELDASLKEGRFKNTMTLAVVTERLPS
jgi:hypothetical protein